MSAARPRILEVLYSFGIGGSQLLGVELARQLRDDGAEVLCAALDSTPGPVSQRCSEYGLPLVDLAVPTRSPFGRNGVSWGLVRRLRGLGVQALHLQHFLGLNKLGLPGRLAGIDRIVVTEHSVLDVSQSCMARFRTRLNWRLASAITVVHRGIKDYLCSRLKVPADRVSVIPVGIDVDGLQRDDRALRRRELGLGAECVLVFVGRVAPVKNVPQLVASFLAVQSQGGPRSRLLVVGDGEDLPAVRELVAAHPLGSRVTLAGEQRDVRPYLAAADVFVLNSSSEGMPRALLEAMATGIPAICPAVGDIPAIVEGRGWLTDPGAPSSLERVMRSVMADFGSIQAAGEASRTYVREHFDARVVAASYRRLLLPP